MCRHITTVYLCGHRVIAPAESTCTDKATHRGGILSYFKSGKSDSACPVCHGRILVESRDRVMAETQKKRLKELKNRPVVDWLEKIREAGAPGT